MLSKILFYITNTLKNIDTQYKIIVFQVSYIIFLTLYAIILLSDFNPAIEIKEIVLIVWTFTLFSEEIRQVKVYNTVQNWLHFYLS